MEDLLEKVVEDGGAISPQTTNVLLKCVDGLRRHLADLRSGNRESGYLGQLAGDLVASQAEPPVSDAAARATYVGEVRFQPDLPTAGLKAQLIYEKLVKLGDVSDCQPLPEQLDAIDRLDAFRFRVTTAQSAEAVAGQLRVSGVQEVKIEPLAASAVVGPASRRSDFSADGRDARPTDDGRDARPTVPSKSQPEANPHAAPGHRPAETVRVDTDRLDQLMDLAGQLVISRAQFSQIGERLKAAVDGHPIVRELFEAIHQLERVSDGIQKSVMDIRMVPIGPLFARFQRVVRDISRSGGKEVRLEILGEKTELDKRMIDELGDPLVHLVRNSANHGIEPPEERQAVGKPRQGTVTLDAFHRGNSIVIEVRDDGRGLNVGRIRRKAIDKGLLTEADANRMTPQQIQQLIWKPGLSTAEKVTNVSGRGMGMDIVKTKIEELSGAVDIDSVQGTGTTIRIKLPLTLAILPSLMVQIAGDVFAMPLEAVTKIVGVNRNHIRAVHGQRMTTVRGRVISVVRLDDVLRFRRPAGDAQAAAETTLVVVGDAGREIGLAVNRVIGEEDVVIKAIAENYKNVPGVAGASVLGDGRVALILDVPALIAALSNKTAHATC